jgi:hypothetical protein
MDLQRHIDHYRRVVVGARQGREEGKRRGGKFGH